MYSLYPKYKSGGEYAAIARVKTLNDMKKEVVVTVRVDAATDDIIRSLAEKDDRTVAWTIRKLITEALEARKLLKSKSKK